MQKFSIFSLSHLLCEIKSKSVANYVEGNKATAWVADAEGNKAISAEFIRIFTFIFIFTSESSLHGLQMQMRYTTDLHNHDDSGNACMSIPHVVSRLGFTMEYSIVRQ